MLKSELIELIKEMEDDSNIDEVILGQGFAKPIDLEGFKDLLANNEEIKGYHTSLLDSAVSKGVESFKKNKMPKYIEEEIKKKSNEGKTPEQIELEELKNTIANMQKEKARAELSSKYIKILGEKKLPTELIDFILNDDETVIDNNITKFETLFNTYVDNGIKARIGDNTYTPPKGQTVKSMTKQELLAKGVIFASQFQQDNPEEYKLIMNS